eukprot:GFUD01035430.1.p1 GENE.GFUD01035430.1~~GFUD01035430.1.p1  ORF type:complete len:611 (-),score=162.78 GFUD01035430.1:61-1893(-)
MKTDRQSFIQMLSLTILSLKTVLIFLLSFVSSSNTPVNAIHGGFYVGRISEGQFEYSDLNGWMTPRKAKELCEKDAKCGGFTYKGSKILDRDYEIYFFHIVINVEKDLNSFKWIYYQANKSFTIFQGIFENENEDGVKSRQFVNTKISGISPEEKCEMDIECVAILKTKNVSTAILVDYLDIDTFKMSNEKTTLVKIVNATRKTNIYATSPWDNLDICCPEHGKVNTKKLLKTINDSMPRISCDIPRDEFVSRYVKRREPVILVNCTKDWIAQKEWSPEKLLNQGGGKLMWKSDFETKGEVFEEFHDQETLPGDILQKIIENNGTIKVFDSIAKQRHTFERRNGQKLNSDKMHLFTDYSKPKPVPEDYFEKAGLLTDYQWVLIGSKGTGTELHTDPEYTSAWNTVLSGHKWWVLMPPEVQPDPFLCYEDCSCEDCGNGGIRIHSWFTHVLPQLRGRKWYGKTVREFIQGPGETIYMPGNLAHAVMNIDNTLSVTENYFLDDSLDDWVHGLIAGKQLLHGYSTRHWEQEVFWKAMYYKLLDSRDREVVRSMRDQVEYMVNNVDTACDDVDEEYGHELDNEYELDDDADEEKDEQDNEENEIEKEDNEETWE